MEMMQQVLILTQILRAAPAPQATQNPVRMSRPPQQKPEPKHLYRANDTPHKKGNIIPSHL